MEFNVQTQSKVLVLSMHQEPFQLIHSNADDFVAAATLAIGGSLRVVLDMGQVEYLDSRGLNALITLERTLRRRGGDLLLAGMQESLWKLFQQSRLYRLFEIYESPHEAIKSFLLEKV